MKLKKFVAENNHKAIQLVHDELGPEALIYSTRSVKQGVEIIAGVANFAVDQHELLVEPDTTSSRDEQLQNNIAWQETTTGNEPHLLDRLQNQLQVMDNTVSNLSQHINSRFLEGFYLSDDEQQLQRRYIYYYLSKLGFRGKFCQQFVESFIRHNPQQKKPQEANIQRALLHTINTAPYELIDDKNICALVGPSGVGKTASLIKLLRRHTDRYGSQSVGIITTDQQDANAHSQLMYFTSLYQVELEYANNVRELSLALDLFKHKNLVLIDTPGISQRNHGACNTLLEFLESQGDLIKILLVLPATTQELVLDEIVRAFYSINLKGCIFTRKDECVSLATALSVSLNYQLDIHYIGTGSGIKDIEVAHSEKLLQQISVDCLDEKQSVEAHLQKNLDRVTKTIKEGIYER